MNDFDDLNNMEELLVPRNHIRDRTNPLEELDDVEFYEKFRFRKESIHFIMELIEPDLTRHVARGVPVPILLQLLGTIRFMATGSFQSVVGELINISQPTMSRMVRRVSRVIASKSSTVVKFPTNEDVISHQRKFLEIGGFPGVVGTIDCSHVKIQSPGIYALTC